MPELLFDPAEVAEKWNQTLRSGGRTRLTNSDLHRLWIDIIRLRVGDAWPRISMCVLAAVFNQVEGVLKLARYYPNQDENRESSHFEFKPDHGEATDLSLEPYEYFPKGNRYSLTLNTEIEIPVLREGHSFPRAVPLLISDGNRFGLAADSWQNHLSHPNKLSFD